MPSRPAKNVPKQQEEQRTPWWSWRRSKTSRETTPVPESVMDLSTKTVDTKDIVKEIEEEEIEQQGK